jgi:predicted ATPase
MIHKLILKNFKRFEEETFLFNNFDLIVGINNSGKSTALQALAIWQFCVEQFKNNKRKSGTNGIQIVLPNFTALPVPEFILLWNNKTERKYEGKSNLSLIYIEIDVYWKNSIGKEKNFCVQLRYQSPQALFARPLKGWSEFNAINETEEMPYIVYVPPFSGLEPHEKWLAEGNVRQNIGKAQPGSVLRNLLHRVIDREDVSIKDNQDWQEIKTRINEWFGIELQTPEYDPISDTEIVVEYKANKKTFDIISGGSGFHQILTLLAFMYGYKQTTTILFDEPDAHLHVNLQRQILNYLKKNAETQILIATHSEEFIKNVEFNSILSILSGKPKRVKSTNSIITAMSAVENIDIVRTQASPYILDLEGEDDERILSAWANTLNKNDIYLKFYPYFLRGSTKKEMSKIADEHYNALKQIVPNLNRAILLDYDNEEVAINPLSDQPFFNEWKRKNIDNYLLVPQAWKRAIKENSNVRGLFLESYNSVIDKFFSERGLTLTNASSWRNIKTPGFDLADGKKLLFENQDCLFEQIKGIDDIKLKINRSNVAAAMIRDEIHEDILTFFDNLEKIVENSES